MQYVKYRDIAEDLTHNVFVKAMEHKEQFRNDSSTYTWLYRIATNLCLNYLRDHRREIVVDEIALETVLGEEEGEIDLPLKKVMINNLLSGFCTTTRRIVFLAMFERLSQEEIAEVLKLSRNTVQKKWNSFLLQSRKRCGIKTTDMGENDET
jgi:RNA polymerase sigma-70 factor (ECF subfamily)